MKKYTRWIIPAALVLLAVVYFALPKAGRNIAYDVNILKNSDFESVTGEGLPESWYTEAYVLSPGVTLYEMADGKEGKGVQLINKGANDARFAQTVQVEPNTIYCLEGDILADAQQGRGANLSVGGVYAFSDSLYSSDGWQHIKTYGMTGENQKELTVFARLGGYSGESLGSAVFDNVRLYPVKTMPKDAQLSMWYVQSAAPVEIETETDNGNAPAWPVLVLVALLYVLAAYLMAQKAEKLHTRDLTREKEDIISMYALLIAAAFIRLVVALLVPGYSVDIGCFTAWSNRMAEVGPALFYHTEMHSDYPPGYMLVLWPLGILGRLFGTGATEWMVKLPPILCDLAAIYLLYKWALEETSNRPMSVMLAALYAFNPLTVLTGAAWGQVDSVTALCIMLVVRFAIKCNWKAALPIYVIAVLMKPQALMFGPLGAIALIADFIWRKDPKKWKDVLLGAAFALAAALIIVIPFSVKEQGFEWLINLYTGTMTFYDRATVNATNLFFLFELNWSMLDKAAPILLKFTGALTILVPLFWYFSRKKWQLPGEKGERLTSVIFLSLTLLPLIVLLAAPLQLDAMGYALMLSVFMLVTWQYIRGNDIRQLPLLGAVVLIGFCVLGSMMHERYLFPALLLLMLAYIMRRDKRILALMLLLTLVVFLNVGLVLNRGTRIGGVAGHLDAPLHQIASDSAWLEYLLSALSVLMAGYALYLGFVLTGKDYTVQTLNIAQPLEEEEAPEINMPLRQLTNPWQRQKITRKDWALIIAITLLYTVLALTNLGSPVAPQKAWVSAEVEDEVLVDLGESRSFYVLYYPGIHWNDWLFTLSVGEDTQQMTSTPADVKPGTCFAWKYQNTQQAGNDPNKFTGIHTEHTGRYVKLTAGNIGLTLFEMKFMDSKTGEFITPTLLSGIGEGLFDEQDTLRGEPSWYDSMYFDEIYHARTAYEQLNALRGLEPSSIYETTHPPLGKVLMTLSISIFSMTPFGWRLAGALAGALMLPGMYLMGRLFTKRRHAALLSMLFMAFDCMHFAQTRIATIDSFVTLFIIWATYYMFKYVLMDYYNTPFKKTLVPLGLSGMFMGLAIASKWTGCYAGAGLGVVFFWSFIRRMRQGQAAQEYVAQEGEASPVITLAANEWKQRSLRTLLWCVVFFVLVPLIIYYLSYYPVFAATPGGLSIPKVIQSAEHMLKYHATPGLGMDHPYYSPWYLWPISQKPMWYYSSSRAAGTGSTIFAFGSPAVWWTGLLALLAIVCVLLRRRVALRPLRLRANHESDMRPALIVIAFLAQYLPWALVPRGTYIYHYFPAVPFIILATSYVLDVLQDRFGGRIKYLSYALMGISGVLFLGFYPYVSGLRVPTWWLDLMRWFPGIWY